MECINWSLVMRQEYLTGALVEQMEMSKTPSGADGILPHAPEAFKRVEGVPTMGWEAMEAKRGVVVLQGRVELVCSVDPAPIDDPHDLFAGFAEGGHHLMEILA
jgi:hypothetical protein